MRPEEISGDLSTDLEWMTHLLRFLEQEEGEQGLPDLVVHLRPT